MRCIEGVAVRKTSDSIWRWQYVGRRAIGEGTVVSGFRVGDHAAWSTRREKEDTKEDRKEDPRGSPHTTLALKEHSSPVAESRLLHLVKNPCPRNARNSPVLYTLFIPERLVVAGREVGGLGGWTQDTKRGLKLFPNIQWAASFLSCPQNQTASLYNVFF